MPGPTLVNLTTLFRVSGALVFAVALAVTGNALVRQWPATAALHQGEVGSALIRALVGNAALFTLFAAHHSLFARTGLKERLRALLTAANQRTVYVWLASLLLILVVFAWQPIGHITWALPPLWRPLMLVLQAAGVLVIGSAARVIDVFELAGVRVPTNHGIQVRGPYRLVRHPIYLGFLLVVWCPATMTGDRLWFAALSTLYLLLAIPLEERSLQRSLGPDYGAYRTRVRWRVVPGIY